jgi:hypothetical protein
MTHTTTYSSGTLVPQTPEQKRKVLYGLDLYHLTAWHGVEPQDLDPTAHVPSATSEPAPL